MRPAPLTSAEWSAHLAACQEVAARNTPGTDTSTDVTDDRAEERQAHREGVYDSEPDQDYWAGRRSG